MDDGRNRGLVLNISETAFPHSINIVLLEPCSHIFWSYTYRDDKLNRIEKRADKQAFASHLNQSMTQELFRQISPKTVKPCEIGYQTEIDDADLTLDQQMDLREKQVNLVTTSQGLKCLGSNTDGDYELAYGRTFQQGPYHIIETLVYFSH